MNRRILSAWPFAVILATLLATFWPILFGGYTLYQTDITNELFLPFAAGKSGTNVQVTSIIDYVDTYYPLRWFQALSFRSGHLNLWNPYLMGGYPAFASTGSVVSLDPFNVLLLWPDLPSALAWRTFLQVLSCAAFMYLYLRHLGLGIPARVVGSLGYSLNSMFWVNIFDWSIEGMLWLPLVLLLLSKAVRARSVYWAVAAGLALGVALLSSPLQIQFYQCFTLVGLLVLHWLLVERNRESLWLCLRLGLLTFAIGIGLAAVQLLPTLELLGESPRMEGAVAGRSPRTASQMLVATAALSSFVFPNLAGRIKNSIMVSGTLWGGETHWQGFIGVVPFLLAVLGAAAGRERRRMPYLCLALFVLVAVLYTPIVLFVYERFFLAYIFCASVLAALGCQALQDGTLRAPAARLTLQVATVFCGLVAVVVVLFNVAFFSHGEQLSSQLEKAMQARLATNYLGTAVPELYLQKARSFMSDFLLTSPHMSIPLAVAGLGLLVVFLRLSVRLKPAPFGAAVIALTAADMIFMTVTHIPFVDLQKYPFTPDAAVIDLIKTDKALFRVASFSPAGERPVLPIGVLATYGIQTSNGSDNLEPPNLRYLVEFESKNAGSVVEPSGIDLANVKYVVTGPRTVLNAPRFERLYDREVRLYENHDVLPRAFWVGSYELIPDWRTALTRVKSESFDPRSTVILDQTPGFVSAAIHAASGSAEVLEHLATRVRIRTESASPGILVVSDTYASGWQVSVDGQPSSILRANGVMRAVTLEGGTHLVQFEYRPKSFRVGAGISLASLLTSTAFLATAGLARRKQG